MKNKILVIGIVVVLLVLAVVYMVPSDYFEVEHNDPLYTVQQRIVGELTFADGTTERIGNLAFPLAITHNGETVTAFTWILEAKATTPAGYEQYAFCEMDWAGNNGDEAMYAKYRVQGALPPGDYGPPFIVDYGTWNPTTTEPVMLIPDNPSWTTLTQFTIQLDKFTPTTTNGDYEIVVSTFGEGTFRGKAGSDYGPVQTQDYTQLETATVGIEWVGSSVTVSWNTRITFG
jgi:hypothetical protein